MPVDAVDRIGSHFVEVNVFSMNVDCIEPGLFSVGFDDLEVIELAEFFKFMKVHDRAGGVLGGKEETVHTGINVIADEIKGGGSNG